MKVNITLPISRYISLFTRQTHFSTKRTSLPSNSSFVQKKGTSFSDDFFSDENKNFFSVQNRDSSLPWKKKDLFSSKTETSFSEENKDFFLRRTSLSVEKRDFFFRRFFFLSMKIKTSFPSKTETPLSAENRLFSPWKKKRLLLQPKTDF